MTIEYTSEDDGFKEIDIDTFEDIKLGKDETKFYKLSGEVETFSKLIRKSGFPIVLIKKCAAN